MNIAPDWVTFSQIGLTLVVLGLSVWQIWLLKKTVKATETAAYAARDSAEIAENSLRLLNQPWLDTADWKVVVNHGAAIPDGYGDYTQDTLGFTASFNVINNSPTPATLHRLDITQTATVTRDTYVSEQIDAFMPPGSKHPAHIDISLNESQRKECAENGTVVDIRGIVHFGDMFKTERPTGFGPRQRHFGRRCVLREHGSEFHPLQGAERIEPDADHGEKGQSKDLP